MGTNFLDHTKQNKETLGSSVRVCLGRHIGKTKITPSKQVFLRYVDLRSQNLPKIHKYSQIENTTYRGHRLHCPTFIASAPPRGTSSCLLCQGQKQVQYPPVSHRKPFRSGSRFFRRKKPSKYTPRY